MPKSAQSAPKSGQRVSKSAPRAPQDAKKDSVWDPLEDQRSSLFEQNCENFFQNEGKELQEWIQHAVRDERAADSECFAQPPRAGGKKAQGN